MSNFIKYLTALKNIIVGLLIVVVTVAVIHFPYDVDERLTQQELEAAGKFYTDAIKIQ